MSDAGAADPLGVIAGLLNDRGPAGALAEVARFVDRSKGTPALPRGMAEALGAESALELIRFAVEHRLEPPLTDASNALALQLPWLAYVPDHNDALANMARQAYRPQGNPTAMSGPPASIRLVKPEGPSAKLALEYTLGRKIALVVDEIPEPDPRVPRAAVTYPAWILVGTEVMPAAEQPEAEAYAALVVSTQPFWSISEVLADAHATLHGGLDAAALSALATHPPLTPTGIPPWRWVRRWQVVCCFALAEMGASRYLMDMALGPDDWLVDASVAALRTYAGRNPEHREWILELVDLVVDMAAHRLGTTPISHFGSLCDLLASMPDVGADTRERALDWGRQWRGE